MAIDPVTGTSSTVGTGTTVSFTPAEQLENLEATDTAAMLGLAGPTPPISAPGGVVFTPSEQLLAMQAQTDQTTLTASGLAVSDAAPDDALFSAMENYSLYNSAGTALALQQLTTPQPPLPTTVEG